MIHSQAPPLSFAERSERALVALLVVLPPLFVWFWGENGYDFPKKLLIAMLAVLLLCAQGFRALAGRPIRIELHPINGLIALFIGWNFLSIAWARSPSLAFERSVWLAVVFGAAMLVQSHLIGRRGLFSRVAGWWTLAAALLAIWALAMDFWLAFDPVSVPVMARLGDWRDAISAAGLGNTGHIADFLVLAFPAALMLFLHETCAAWRIVRAAALVLIAAALIVCWSVHSNASLILAFGAGAIVLWRARPAKWWRRRLPRAAVLGALWIAVIAFFVLPHPLNPNRGPQGGGIFQQAFASPRWKEGGPTRLAIWITTLQLIRDRTILGAGAGNFTFAYPSADSPWLQADERLKVYAHKWTNAAHNDFLQTWAELGVFGFALYAAIVAAAFYYLVRRIRAESPGNRLILGAAGISLGAWMLQSQMNFPLQMPVGTLWFALLVSVPVCLPERQPRGISPIYVPVEFERAGVRLTVYLENMSRPVRAGIACGSGALARGAWAIFLCAALVFTAWIAWRGLEAQTLFRDAKGRANAWLHAPGGNTPSGARRALAAAQPYYARALQLWPWMTDCRSAWSGLLVSAGKWDAAVEQGALVRRRLDATEVYMREATARWALGQKSEAARAFSVVMRREPEAAEYYPELAALAKELEARESPAAHEK